MYHPQDTPGLRAEELAVTKPAEEGVVEAVPEEKYSLQEKRDGQVGCTGPPISSLCTFPKDSSSFLPASFCSCQFLC